MGMKINKLVTYRFEIQAEAPVYFGAERPGELIKNSIGKPILLGNSIGGALRSFMEQNEASQNHITSYMGGSNQNDFIESKIYISDGKIELNEKKICTKEGTAINPDYGTAEDGNKYTLEHLPKGCSIVFEVECDIDSTDNERTFNKIIGTWANGFRERHIRLGGQQSNGFGTFSLSKLEKAEFSFTGKDSINKFIEQYIIKDKNNNFNTINEAALESYDITNENEVTFTLEGDFPYGVYQAFDIGMNEDGKDITGLQKSDGVYYIPASSLKGLVRNEIRLLLKRFINDEKLLTEKLEVIFGGKKEKGKIVFSDIKLDYAKDIKIKRYEKDKAGIEQLMQGDPVYIKIDRITGGNIDGAMKTQREVSGQAVLKLQLMDNDDKSPFVFPLIYVLKRIGMGYVPIGGRTSIGLGEFKGETVKLEGKINEEYPSSGALTSDQKNTLEMYYNSFKGWCEQ